MSTKYNLESFETDDLLFTAAANFIIDIAHRNVAEKGKFSIVLSGGNTPNKLYSLLATNKFNNQMPWKNTFVFWGDERCVALSDKLNNAHVAISLLLDKVDIPPLNIFTIPVNLSAREAAIQYEQTIRSFFSNEAPAFDLVLLGLGENAHTASLFPGTEVLTETDRLVKEVYVEEQKMFRVTMTAPLINLAHDVAFLVTGEAKAAALQSVLKGPCQPDKYPAQLIKPAKGKLYWFVDNLAAELL